jgi:hypothetical protein
MDGKRKIVKSPMGVDRPESTAITSSEEFARSDLALIPHEVFQGKIKALRERTTITNDKGEEIVFDGVAKEDFVGAFEAGYPVLQKTLAGLYELGSFLLGVRAKLKPQKLYHTWLDYAGIPRGTAQSYVQACDRYREKLPQFSGLGIRKLLIASRLPDCVDYVEKHEQEIAAQTAEELERQVKRLRQQKHKKATRVGRKPKYVSVGAYRIRPSMDGSKITIEGMTKSEQEDFMSAIKEMLSRKKE